MQIMTPPSDPNAIEKSNRVTALPRAVYFTISRCAALTAPLPEHGKIAAVVGDVVRFVSALESAPLTFTLLREPPADAPAPVDDGPIVTDARRAIAATRGRIDGGQLQINRPGLYVIRVTLPGGWSRDVGIAAFPAAALDRLRYRPEMGTQRRKRLQHIVADHRVTADTAINALETLASDGCHGISGVLLGAPDSGSAPPLDPGKYA